MCKKFATFCVKISLSSRILKKYSDLIQNDQSPEIETGDFFRDSIKVIFVQTECECYVDCAPVSGVHYPSGAGKEMGPR